MEIIQWQDDYSVGVQELDDQHRRLLNIINALIMEEKNFPGTLELKNEISTLIHYAYTHFATEERYLKQAQFPDLPVHILKHIDFIMTTLKMALYDEGTGKQNRQALCRYLIEWYTSHVLGIDRSYIPYLASQPVSFKPS